MVWVQEMSRILQEGTILPGPAENALAWPGDLLSIPEREVASA
jgi:hypothetical protein